MLSPQNRELFDRIWCEAKGPPRQGFFTTLNRLIDAARQQGREMERVPTTASLRQRREPPIAG